MWSQSSYYGDFRALFPKQNHLRPEQYPLAVNRGAIVFTLRWYEPPKLLFYGPAAFASVEKRVRYEQYSMAGWRFTSAVGLEAMCCTGLPQSFSQWLR